jgi:two-component system phosphate regulon sensor histidine kinase PhoR
MQNNPLPFAYELIQSVVEGIIVIDADGQITFANRSAEQITGWAIGDVLGKSIYQLFPEMIGEKPFLDYLASDSSPVPVNVQLRNGLEITLSVTKARLNSTANDRPQMVLVIRDITERNAAQRLRSYFLANISHEFRTPLSALKASVELLLDSGEELSSEETVALLNSILFSLTGLQTLIDNLLESVSIEAGRFQIRRRMTDLNTLSAEAAIIMRPLMDRRKQTLKISTKPHLPHVDVDPMRLTQVLVNLLSNASKYSPMETSIHLSLDLEQGHIKVSVADRGDGIPPEERQNVFRRFIRLDEKDKPQYGIGLGLFLVKTIIEEHGGSVGVNEQPGGGSIFWFTIPIQESEA